MEWPAIARQSPNEQTVMAVSEAVGSTLLASVAARLKQARIKRELSIEELSSTLSVPRPHLEKIESGDFSFLAAPYILAYLKEYCQAMELCDEALFEECRKELAVSSGPPRGELPGAADAGNSGGSAPAGRSLLFSRLSGTAVAMAVIALLLAIVLLGKSLLAAPPAASHSSSSELMVCTLQEASFPSDR